MLFSQIVLMTDAHRQLTILLRADIAGFVLSLLYYRTFFYSVMTPSQSFKRGSMSDSWGHAANRLPGT